MKITDIDSVRIVGDISVIRGVGWEVQTRLSKMMPAEQSLRRDAQDARSEAQAYARRAERLEAAATYLEKLK